MHPRQWSLAKQRSLNVENGRPKVQKQAGAKRDGVINPQNYNFNQFYYGKQKAEHLLKGMGLTWTA